MTTFATSSVIAVSLLVCSLLAFATVALIARIRTLERAIRKHRDARGNDRCHLNDHELYNVLAPAEASAQAGCHNLPAKTEFLGNCERFYEGQTARGGCPACAKPVRHPRSLRASLERSIRLSRALTEEQRRRERPT